MAAYHRLRTIVTAPGGTPLIVDRVDTSVAGLYGLGCATFTQPGIRWSRSSSSTWSGSWWAAIQAISRISYA
jgi:hypothetical protein